MAISATGVMSALTPSPSKYHIYKDKAGEWRWRLVASNGRNIANSGEGYVAKESCKEGIELVKASINAEVVDD